MVSGNASPGGTVAVDLPKFEGYTGFSPFKYAFRCLSMLVHLCLHHFDCVLVLSVPLCRTGSDGKALNAWDNTEKRPTAGHAWVYSSIQASRTYAANPDLAALKLKTIPKCTDELCKASKC